MNSSNAFSSCHVMAKPSGSICNLDCEYCFYLEKEKIYPERNKNWKMDDKTLRAFIKQQIEAQDTEHVDIAWQGGEPTLLGIDFYKKAVKYATQYAQGKSVHHGFQTNGMLINDEWCQFFKQNNFLVGISIDGPADLHDAYRVTRSGKGSHQKVMEAIDCLKKHDVAFNTLTVVNDLNSKHPKEVYRFLKSIGAQHMQFIPLVERQTTQLDEKQLQLIHPGQDLAASVTDWSVPSWQYGEFLNQIFDRWIKTDVGRIFIQIFDSTLANWCGQPGGVCTFSTTCGHALALEANGDLYACDHFVYPEYKLGNIHEIAIRELNSSESALRFGQDKQTRLTPDCQQCQFKFACNGGCPKQRFILSPKSFPHHNYLCAGYLHFFNHIAPYMTTMRDLIKQRRAPAEIMNLVNRPVNIVNVQQATRQRVGRNAPCPCASGKKFKQCCGCST